MNNKELRLASKIIATLVKDRLYYPIRLVADTGGIVARFGVLMMLYWYVFKLKGGTVAGVDFPTVAWSMFFYFSFMVINLRHIARLIKIDIIAGTVDILFSRPINYLLYRVWWQIGLGLYPFLVLTPIFSVLLYLIVGVPTIMTTSLFWLTFPVVFMGSFILVLLVYGIVGLLAFWIEDIRPVFWIIDKMVMILGGSYLPIALFPTFLYKLSVYSPFGASMFISHTVNPDWVEVWSKLLLIQLVWIGILGLVIYFMFERARKILSVNGG